MTDQGVAGLEVQAIEAEIAKTQRRKDSVPRWRALCFARSAQVI